MFPVDLNLVTKFVRLKGIKVYSLYRYFMLFLGEKKVCNYARFSYCFSIPGINA